MRGFGLNGCRPLWRAVAAVSLAAALIPGVAGCSQPVPHVSGASASEPVPVLTEKQEQAIRTRILDTLVKADEARDPAGLDAYLESPALDVRTSQLTVSKATGAIDPHSVIPSDISQTVIPTDSGWPRSVFTITTTTDDQQTQRLMVLDQQTPRSNYKLWGLVRLFQGAQLPAFEIPTIGSSMGSADDSGLVCTPQEAVTRYADVLQNGSNSQYADQFADDQLRQDLATLTQNVQQGIEANAGTQEQTFTPTDQIRVMRAADGGDLVVARIDSEWTRAAGEGRESLPASETEQALFGDGTATSTMKVTYVNVVALFVPQKDSGDKIQAVGAERQAVKVEAL